MTCYIVTFETHADASREGVRDVLKSYGLYCPVHQYCWAIMTNENAKEVRDKITNVLAQGERVFVVRSGTEAAWFNTYSEKNNAWLKENL